MACSLFTSDVATSEFSSVPPVSLDADGAVLWLAGEHDIATAPLVLEALAEATSADHAGVVVDLSGVKFIDASTIGILMAARSRLLSQSRDLTVRFPSKAARRLLDACGLNQLIVTA